MPRYPARRAPRATRRRTYKRSRFGMRRFKPLSYTQGHLVLKRKLPEINMYNTSVQGQYTLTPQNCVELGNPIQNFQNTYDIPFAMKFRLDQIINSSDITNFADQYKIKYVTIKLYFNSNTATVSGNSSLPVIQYIVDHDDASLAGASVNALREKMGVKFKNFTANKNVIKMALQPRVSQAVFNNGIIQPVAYQVPSNPVWLNSAYPGVEHYGIKGILTNVMLPATVGVSTYFKWDVEITLEAKDFQ